MKNVYFNEYNVNLGGRNYLPLVSGLLRGYAETSQSVREGYRFMPFIYSIEHFAQILSRYKDVPNIAAFSTSMWNEQLNLNVAWYLKSDYPEMLTIFGGCQVPHDARKYMEDNSFIDICVSGDGEEIFRSVLERFLVSRDFSGIPSLTWRDFSSRKIYSNDEKMELSRDLDHYPSPYMNGYFDGFNGPEFQAVIETNRGCPFPCSFCYWGGGGLKRKYRYFSLERVFKELEWCALHNIEYIFNSDSNFGMHGRDREIAEFIVSLKEKYGYPHKFRTCYGKNTDEKIFQIGALLHRHGLEKGITLARQTNDEEVLKNINRDNIKMKTYENLQRRFNDTGVPVYTELIIGLPGETLQTWETGLNEMLCSGLENQLMIYPCQVYPNTELSDHGYAVRHGIKTVSNKLNEIHGSIRDASWVLEYENLIIETNSMSSHDWQKMMILSWFTMLMHGMKCGYYVLIYLYRILGVKPVDVIRLLAFGEFLHWEPVKGIQDFFMEKANAIMEGKGRGCVVDGSYPVYWEPEEAAFIQLSGNWHGFYSEMFNVMADKFVPAGKRGMFTEVLAYQHSRMPSMDGWRKHRLEFSCNFPEYFDRLFTSEPVELKEEPQEMMVSADGFQNDLPEFTKRKILWGRKSGTILRPVQYKSLMEAV